MVPQVDDIPDISSFLEQIERARRDLDFTEEVPGWVLHRPSVTQVEDDMAFLVAESKPDASRKPFILPNREAVLAVTRGSVHVSGVPGPLTGPTFWTVHKGDGREVRSLSHPTTIICIFFRGRGDDEGRFPLPTRQVDRPGENC